MTGSDGLANIKNTVVRGLNVNPVSFSADKGYQRNHLIAFLNEHLVRREGAIAELTQEESSFGHINGLKSEEKILADLVLRREHCKVAVASVNGKERVKCLEALGYLPGEIARQQQLVTLLNGQFNLGKPEVALQNQGSQQQLVLQMSFPRGISVLRKAYEENNIFGFVNQGKSAPRSQLRLNLAEAAREDDSVPTSSGDQGSASMEAIMAQIASTLGEEKIAVAVLSATDVLDEIFVARYLHEHAPGVTVVVQDGDLLFLRDGSDSSMEDAYVVGPYPLNVSNQDWSADSRPEKQFFFASQGDEGTEHAMGYLLCGLPRAIDCPWNPRKGFKGSALTETEYQPPFPIKDIENDYKLQPPLWLSVISHGGFRPISLIDVDERVWNLPDSSALSLPRLGTVEQMPDGSEKKFPDTNPVGIWLTTPTQLKAFALLLVSLMALHSWACLRCQLDRSFAWSYASSDVGQWKLGFTTQASISCLGIFAFGILLIHNYQGFRIESWQFRAALVLAQLLLIIVVGATATRISAASPDARARRTAVGMAIAAAVVSTILADTWFWLWFAPEPVRSSERLFFFYREAYVLSGASPTLPLLLLFAAFNYWLVSRFGKMVFAGCRVPQLPTAGTAYRCPSPLDVTPINVLLGGVIRQDGPEAGRLNWPKLRLSAASLLLVCGGLFLAGQLGPQSLAYSRFDLLVDILCLGLASATLHNLNLDITFPEAGRQVSVWNAPIVNSDFSQG